MTRPNEITCNCTAYPFPHRLTGGRCTGSHLAHLVRTYCSHECLYCNLNTGAGCDAETGAESILEGDCFSSYLGTNTKNIPPVEPDWPPNREDTEL